MKNYDELILKEKEALLAIDSKYQVRLKELNDELQSLNKAKAEEKKDHFSLLKKLREMKFESFLKSDEYMNFISGIKQNRVIPMTEDMKFHYIICPYDIFTYYINISDPSKYGMNLKCKNYRKVEIL